MAFKLTGIVGIDLDPEEFSRELRGETFTIQLLPLIPSMEVTANDRSSVMANSDGSFELQGVRRLQLALFREVCGSWDLEDRKGKPVRVSQKTIEALALEGKECAEFIKDAVDRARILFSERRADRDEESNEGN